MTYTSIADFYAEKSIFITGGTGFIGKAYVQKILYSCPKVDKIYMMIRANSIEHANERIKQMIDNSFQLFEKLQQERPEDLKKIVPVVGDLAAPKLGISENEKRLLLEKVSIVIHSAATVNFNEILQTAYDYNVGGTRKVLDLAKQMKKIEAFIHVSTIYLAGIGDRIVIDEVFYPPPTNHEDIVEILEKYGSMKPIASEERTLPTEILAGHPNTYTFTKSLAENLVKTTHDDLPIAIVRPSLVASSEHEPYKGWIDKLNPHSACFLAIGKGIIRCVYGNKTIIIDLIPVDYVANLMIVAATQCERSNIAIYNCGTSGCNPVTYEKTYDSFVKECVEHKFNDLPFPGVYQSQSKLVIIVLTFLTQTLPAYLIDFWCYIRGKPSKQVENQKKLARYIEHFKYFIAHSWRAKSDHIRNLLNTLEYRDKSQFICDPAMVSWEEYFRYYSQGARNIYNASKKKKETHTKN